MMQVDNRFYWPFSAAFGGDVTQQLGTWTVAGGIAQPATLVVDGNNLVSNGESWTGGPPPTEWTEWSATGTQRDFDAYPGGAPGIAPTGGLDEYGVEVDLSAGNGSFRQFPGGLALGASYVATVRAYSPSGNTASYAAQLYARFLDIGGVNTTVQDVWQTLTRTGLCDSVIESVALYVISGTFTDVGYFDYAIVQQQRAIATRDLGSPHLRLATNQPLPASGVVPFGYLVRYQDASNYWLFEIIPGTAGADFQLVEMNDGTQTVRDSADIDWTPGATYAVEASAIGRDFAASVAGVAALAYTDTTDFLATSNNHGILANDTTLATFAPINGEVY